MWWDFRKRSDGSAGHKSVCFVRDSPATQSLLCLSLSVTLVLPGHMYSFVQTLPHTTPPQSCGATGPGRMPVLLRSPCSSRAPSTRCRQDPSSPDHGMDNHREEMGEITRVTSSNHNRSDTADIGHLVLTFYCVAVIFPGMMTLWAPVAGLKTGATGNTTPSRCSASQKPSCS